MRLISFKIHFFVTSLFITSCADKSSLSNKVSDSPVSPYLLNPEMLSSIDNKYLFLQDYYNEKGEKEFMEPYHYHFSADAAVLGKQVKNQFEFGVGIRIPSKDCNLNYLECNEGDGVFNCGGLSTQMHCFYENDLRHYYTIPQYFTIKLEGNSVVITDTKNSSRAHFQIYNSFDELPPFNEPPQTNNHEFTIPNPVPL